MNKKVRYKVINNRWIKHIWIPPLYKTKWFGLKKVIHREGKWIPLYEK